MNIMTYVYKVLVEAFAKVVEEGLGVSVVLEQHEVLDPRVVSPVQVILHHTSHVHHALLTQHNDVQSELLTSWHEIWIVNYSVLTVKNYFSFHSRRNYCNWWHKRKYFFLETLIF